MPDLYSLGVVMYELLTGTSPFKRATPLATAHAHLHDTAPPLRSVNPTIPEALQEVASRCLVKAPRERFRSARELFEALVASEGRA